MSKDYAKTRESRRRGRPAKNTKAKSNFTWLVVGLVMGIIIAGLSFLKHRVAATVHPEKKLVINGPAKNKTGNEKPAQMKVSEPEEEKVNFDFYTILPNMKVKAPEEEKPADKPKAHPLSSEAASTVTPKEVQHMEQNLLSPTRSVAVESHPLKPVAVEPALKTAKSAPTAKTVAKHAAVKAEEVVRTELAAKKHEAKQKEMPAAKAAHEHDRKELADRIAHDGKTPGAPVVDLTEARHSLAKGPVANTAYIVQIAAFKRFEDADRLKAQLTLAGYETKVKVVPVSGMTWHRVWIGPYPTAQAAEKIQKELLAKHTKSVVVKVK